MMATGGSGSTQADAPPHGKTTVISKHTALDYGPLTDYKAHPEDQGGYSNNFRGASYMVTTPTGNGLVLYRRYGGAAKEEGHWWTVEQREGNRSFAMDSAILPKWNALSKEVRLVVPPGILLFEGFAAPQHPHAEYGRRDYGPLGGGWQVLIPVAVVGPLLQAQRATAEGKPREEVQKHISAAVSAQKSIIEKYEKKVSEQTRQQLNDFCTMENAQRLLKSGNAIRSLPGPVRNALSSQTSSVTSTGSKSETMPKGSYLVHCETIRLPSGASASVSLHVRIEFSHETTRTYRSGNTIVTETTRYYRRIFEWK